MRRRGSFSRVPEVDKSKAQRQLAQSEMTDILSRSGVDIDCKRVRDALDRATDEAGMVFPARDPLLRKAVEGTLAVPNWEPFLNVVRRCYYGVKASVSSGENADYIPILQRQDPDAFSVSVCTVDGQRFSIGEMVDTSLQSCVSPLVYAAAVDDCGVDEVHKSVGIDPSGLPFNSVKIAADGRAFNPLVNAGTIACVANLRRGEDISTRFSSLMKGVQDAAGGEKVGFSQETYLDEVETAYWNTATIYNMMEGGALPAKSSVSEILDLYTQACSLEVNSQSLANIAAMFANFGTSPTSGQLCHDRHTIDRCLTLMLNCGMNTHSGVWSSSVGLPAKSGISGLLLVVVPNVMGVAIYSPRVNRHANSVRGVAFAKALARELSLGVFDCSITRVRGYTEELGSGLHWEVKWDPTKGEHAKPVAVASPLPSSPAVRTPVKQTLLSRLRSQSLALSSASSPRMHFGTKKQEVFVSAWLVRRCFTRLRVLHANLKLIKSRYLEASSTGLSGTHGPVAPTPHHVPVGCILTYLGVLGLRHRHKALSSLLKDMQSVPGFISLPDIIGFSGAFRSTVTAGVGGPAPTPTSPSIPASNLLVRALLTSIVIPDFTVFREDMKRLFHAAERVDPGPPPALSGMSAEIQRLLGISIGSWSAPAEDVTAGEPTGSRASVPSSSPVLPKRHSRSAEIHKFPATGLSTRSQSAGPSAPELRAAGPSGKLPFLAGSSRGLAGPVPFNRSGGMGGSSLSFGIVSPPQAWKAPETIDEEHDGRRDARGRSDSHPSDGGLAGETNSPVALFETPPLAKPASNSAASGTSTDAGVCPPSDRSSSGKPALPHSETKLPFGLSICTVDGQQFHYGDSNVPVPLMEAVKPLLYALALRDCGAASVHQWVDAEPTVEPVDSFILRASQHEPSTRLLQEVDLSSADPHVPVLGAPPGLSPSTSIPDPLRSAATSPEPDSAKKGVPVQAARATKGVSYAAAKSTRLFPFNPFLTSGALVTCAMIGRAHLSKHERMFRDAGTRFKHILTMFQSLSGREPLSYNNPVFLAMKQHALKVRAIAHYLRGMGCYPPRASPADIAGVYYESCAVEMTSRQLAVVAATFANGGVCPTTEETCVSLEDTKHLVSVMHSCGLASYSGKWSFNVGAPACSGSSGHLMVIIPNVLGLAIYQPNVRESGLSVIAEYFCRLFTRRYHVSLFHQDDGLRRALWLPTFFDVDGVRSRPCAPAYPSAYFQLRMASWFGRTGVVATLLESGVDPTLLDYDNRGCLHLAARGGHLKICRLLVEHGASPNLEDRDGITPILEARESGHARVAEFLSRVALGSASHAAGEVGGPADAP